MQAARSRKRQRLHPVSQPKPTPLVESVNALTLDEFRERYWPVEELGCRFHITETNPQGLHTAESTSHVSRSGQAGGVHAEPGPGPETTSTLHESQRNVKSNRLDDLALTLVASSELSVEAFTICFSLIESLNSKDYAASSIGWHPAKKKAEMRLPDQKYVLLMDAGTGMSGGDQAGAYADEANAKEHVNAVGAVPKDTSPSTAKVIDQVLGFLSFMITYEDGIPVIYIYEIHLHQCIQGHGLGPRLISLIENIGRTIGVQKSMLTVFRSNGRARDLYARLGWVVDEHSPGPRRMRGGRMKDCDYVIMSKKLNGYKT